MVISLSIYEALSASKYAISHLQSGRNPSLKLSNMHFFLLFTLAAITLVAGQIPGFSLGVANKDATYGELRNLINRIYDG